MEQHDRLPSEGSTQDMDSSRQSEGDVPSSNHLMQNISSAIEGISLSGSTVLDNVQNVEGAVPPPNQLVQNIPSTIEGISLSESLQAANHSPVIDQNPEGLTPQQVNWQSLIAFYSSQDSWPFPVPNDDTLKPEREKYFVPMTMDILDRHGNKQIRGESYQLSYMMGPLGVKQCPMRILITADAGYGKSTFCSKLAYDWAQTFKDFPSESTLVLKYRLRDLRNGENLEEELVKFLQYHTQQQQGTDLSEMEKIIEGYGNRLLLIMDGLDEVTPLNHDQVKNILSMSYSRNHRGSLFRSANIIVTSRPNQTDFWFSLSIDKYLRINGLNQQNRCQLIKNVFEIDEAKISELCGDVFNDKTSPLNIILVSWSFLQGIDNRRLNQSELVIGCMRLMARRSNDRLGSNLDENRINEMLSSLEKLFLELEQRNCSTIDADSAKGILGDFYQVAITSGILNSVRADRTREGERFEAGHKLFQERLAVYHAERNWSALTSDLERQTQIAKNHRIRFVNIHTNSRVMTFGSKNNNLFYTFKYDLETRCFSLHACLEWNRDHCRECAQEKMEPLVEVEIVPMFQQKWSLVCPMFASICEEFPDNESYINILLECENLLSPETLLNWSYPLFRIFDGRDEKVLPIPHNTPRFGQHNSFTKVERVPVPFAVNTVQAPFAFTDQGLHFKVKECKAMSASDLNQYLSGITKAIGDLSPDVSQAQSLEECFHIWAMFFTDSFKAQKNYRVDFRVGNNQGDILCTISRGELVIQNYRVDWPNCTMLEFSYGLRVL